MKFSLPVANSDKRKFDVCAFRQNPLGKRAPLLQSVADSSSGGELCTGAQKLAQDVVIELLTEKGSIRYFPDRGCSFMTAVRTGRARTELDVFQAFAASAIDIRRNIEKSYTEDTPDDEKLEILDILGVTIAPGVLKLEIAIVSKAREQKKVLLPLSLNPRD